MFHICKSKSKDKPINVVQTAANGEPLNSHPLKTVQAAIKNIVARMKDVQEPETSNPVLYVYVQDERKDKEIVFYRVYNNGNKELLPTQENLERYIPGKNPKKKKK